MLFSLGRFLQFFIYPDHLGSMGLMVAYFLWRKGRRTLAKRCAIAGVSLIVFANLPIVPWLLTSVLESAYPNRAVGDYPVTDAIVILGGTASQLIAPRFESDESGGSRLLAGARLWRRKKAPVIVVAGGSPYEDRWGRLRTHAEDMREVLIDMGIPKEAILLENRSVNTEEDVLFSADVLKQNHFRTALLVTSAFHMRRAMTFTRGTEIEWTPVPAGYEAPDLPFSIISFLPIIGYGNSTNRTIKEIVGYYYSKAKVAWRLSHQS